jgi:hypothetical protein
MQFAGFTKVLARRTPDRGYRFDHGLRAFFPCAGSCIVHTSLAVQLQCAKTGDLQIVVVTFGRTTSSGPVTG